MTKTNIRKWDMYKDKKLDEKGYIKEVHLMTYDEAYKLTGNELATTGIRNIGARYWLASLDDKSLYNVRHDGYIGSDTSQCYGIRPVVSMNSGVYIAGGEGTAESPYVLGKE